MSDVELTGAGVESGDANVGETKSPTGVNTDFHLAGDGDKIVGESVEESPDTTRGTKRHLSGDETGGGDAVKRVTIDNNVKPQDATKDTSESDDNPLAPDSSCDVSSSKLRDEGKDTKNGNASKEGGQIKESVVIEISDDSSDSSICAVDSYQASAAEVKRIRGDDYSSSSDYSSDSSSSCDDDSVVLNTNKRARTVARRAQLNPRATRADEPALNEALRNADTMDKLGSHWTQGADLNEGDVSLTCKPFKFCLLHNILQNSEIINNIVDDMNTLDWSRKKMDLYEFHQTTDLANLTWQRSIRGIHQLLNNDVMPWISKITGLKLTHTSASCSLYGPGDHLLTHDDLLADRKVAFILYLAPWNLRATPLQNGEHSERAAVEAQGGWTSSMGGALELLECDELRQPTKVVRSIVPRNNTLAFFQVTPESFHQVSEVRSLEFPRLSINGWFHGPDETDAPHEEPQRQPPVALKPHAEVTLLWAWLTPQYLQPRTRLQIQQQMEKASEISLQQFLQPEKYDAILEHLAAPEREWEEAGPANQRRYDRLRLEPVEALEQTHALREFIKLLTSNGMYRFLHDCTDLVLKSHFHFELQRWRANSFTVLPPKESYSQNQLDAVMYLGFPEHPVCGGITTYVAPEEENAPPLVSLEPRNNALNLVFADAQTARFTKHVSNMTMKPEECFYIITCSYQEDSP